MKFDGILPLKSAFAADSALNRFCISAICSYIYVGPICPENEVSARAEGGWENVRPEV
jgi:hypothetical protein